MSLLSVLRVLRGSKQSRVAVHPGNLRKNQKMDVSSILTLDRRGFSTYRMGKGRAFSRVLAAARGS
jgi:hypothetical protein